MFIGKVKVLLISNYCFVKVLGTKALIRTFQDLDFISIVQMKH